MPPNPQLTSNRALARFGGPTIVLALGELPMIGHQTLRRVAMRVHDDRILLQTPRSYYELVNHDTNGGGL